MTKNSSSPDSGNFSEIKFLSLISFHKFDITVKLRFNNFCRKKDAIFTSLFTHIRDPSIWKLFYNHLDKMLQITSHRHFTVLFLGGLRRSCQDIPSSLINLEANEGWNVHIILINWNSLSSPFLKASCYMCSNAWDNRREINSNHNV